MTDGILRPGLAALETAIEKAIARTQQDWDVSLYEAVGVLTVMATRYAHRAIQHDEDEL